MGNLIQSMRNVFRKEPKDATSSTNDIHRQTCETMEIRDLQKQIECLKKINEGRKKENKELAKRLSNTNDDNKSESDNDIDVMVSLTQIEHIVDEMLANKDINISYLPDFVERQIYMNIIRIAMNVIAKTSQTTKIEFLGHEMSLKLNKMPIIDDNDKLEEE